MFIRVLPKAWCRGSCQQPDRTHEKAFATQRTGQSTLSAIPMVSERYATGRVRALMNPYKPRGGIAAPSVSERYVTGRVREQPYPYKLRSGIKKRRIPHMQAGETFIWGIAFGNRLSLL